MSKNRLNFKIWVYSGILVGRGSFGGSDILLDDHARERGHWTGEEDLMVSSLALMQMWVTDGPCVLKIPGAAWTKKTLDACSRGFLTLKNLRCGATGSFRSSDSV